MLNEEQNLTPASPEESPPAPAEQSSKPQDEQPPAPPEDQPATCAESSGGEAGEPNEETATPPDDEQTELLHKLRADNEEMTRLIQRLQADFDNYRKRMRSEKEALRETVLFSFLQQLLPVIDNLERALSAGGGDLPATRSLYDGVELVLRHFLQILEKEGVTRVQALGRPFDPCLHEAVASEKVDGQEAGMVIEEIQAGYCYAGKVLRPSMVKVSS